MPISGQCAIWKKSRVVLERLNSFDGFKTFFLASSMDDYIQPLVTQGIRGTAINLGYSWDAQRTVTGAFDRGAAQWHHVPHCGNGYVTE